MCGGMRLIFSLLVLLSGLAGEPARPSGAQMAMVGMDGFMSRDLVYHDHRYDLIPIDPTFRAEVAAGSLVALGAQLDLIRCFPAHSSPFTSSPGFSIGPSVTCRLPVPPSPLEAYAGAGIGYLYLSGIQNGLRARAWVGGCLEVRPWFRPGLELGYCFDRVAYWYGRRVMAVDSGHKIALGLRWGGRL